MNRPSRLNLEIRMVWHKYSSVHNQEDKVFMTLADTCADQVHAAKLEINPSNISIFAQDCFAGNPDNYTTENLISLFSARLKYLCEEGFLATTDQYKFTITELGLVLYKSITAYVQSRSYLITESLTHEQQNSILNYMLQKGSKQTKVRLRTDPKGYEYVRTATEITMQKILDSRATEIYEINIPTIKESLMQTVVLRPLPLSLNPEEIKHLVMITQNSGQNSVVQAIEVFADEKAAITWAEKQVRSGGKDCRAVRYTFSGSCVLQPPPVEWTTL